ncbi:M20/M25/M40 family metallo-hydrolase [Rhizobium sp. TRM95111]|uniref:M20/M25/M40 family metallo-hydrolase n=1 Tax=Rhizobium alarense TaxID=2846851 RepID=UPI001F354E49|nr:M20/M25/M40 family metallo-hydrolase [Rhizobium alarense]MCF3640534.1 M20/M25/M40 family metallo-hydrolase [Rhizobium alarense]
MTSAPTADRAARARDLTLAMTRWQSVTGSAGEAAFGERLRSLLADLPCFRANPDHLLAFDSHGEPATKNVVALVRGSGRRTIVLAGHFDTVSIANYGTLASLATEPDALLPALLAELRGRVRNAAEDRALADLESGDFLPGRGLLDMKSGIAAGIVALERFAACDDAYGNLLLVATPDEEALSRGMRSLRSVLPDVADRFGLDIIGGINLDASSCEKDGEEGRAVYLGSVGKFLPFAFVVGRATHAGYPFDGISAHRIAAEILRAIDTDPHLRDEAHGETSPAPVCLEMKDLRDTYDVTTPDRVWLAFNWLTHRRSPTTLLDDFRAIVAAAAAAALHRQAENRSVATGTPQVDVQAAVLTYEALLQRVAARGGPEAANRLAALEAELSKIDNPLEITRRLVDAAVTEAGLEGPAIVVGFGSLHYPLVHIDRFGATGEGMRRSLARVMAEVAARHATTIRFKQIFAGISDMSYLGHRPEISDAAALKANTPARIFADDVPPGLLAFPVVNIGPWGRDYHQKWERAHTPYTFGVLPDLVFEAARACLKETS